MLSAEQYKDIAKYSNLFGPTTQGGSKMILGNPSLWGNNAYNRVLEQYPAYAWGESGDFLSDFMERFNYITKMSEKVKLDPAQRKRIEQYQGQMDALLRQLYQGIEGKGAFAPTTMSDDLRKQIIEGQLGSQNRIFDQTAENLLTKGSQQGWLVGGGGTGNQGFLTQAMTEARAKTFEDPMLSFVRNLDIQTELERMNQMQNLKTMIPAVSEFNLQNSQQFAQMLANLDLSNIANRNALLGQATSSEQFDKSMDWDMTKFNQEMRLWEEQLQMAKEAADKQKKSSKLGGIGSIIGGVIGGIAGGPTGAMIGASIGGNVLGGSQGGGMDLSGLASRLPSSWNSTTPQPSTTGMSGNAYGNYSNIDFGSSVNDMFSGMSLNQTNPYVNSGYTTPTTSFGGWGYDSYNPANIGFANQVADKFKMQPFTSTLELE